MALANATNGRVTGHLAQGINSVGQQQRADTGARSRESSLGTRMTAANHDDVVLL